MPKQQFRLILNVILGFSLILYIIYIRVIVTRLPKELYILNIEHKVNMQLLLIISVGVFIALLQIIYNILLLFDITSKKSRLQEKLILLSHVIDNALFETYNFIISNITDAYDKLSVICQKFYATFSKFTEAAFIFIDYIIRSIIVISFLIDIFIFFRLNFMYKALYLLIILLLLKVFIYMLRDIASNLSTLQEDLIVTYKGIDQRTGLPIHSYQFRNPDETANLAYHIEQYILCSKLTGYLEFHEKYRRFYNPYFALVLYFLYFFGWSYVIYINIITS